MRPNVLEGAEKRSSSNASDMGDNAHVTTRGDSGAAEATSHRADGPARIAGPEQPWWRTLLDLHYRTVLHIVGVVVLYASASVWAIRRDDSWPVAIVWLLLAAVTVVSFVAWLRPAHRWRRWALVSLVLLTTAPFVWLYVSR